MKRIAALLLCVGLLATGCQTTIGTNIQQGRAFDAMNERLFDLYHAKLQASGSDDPILYEDTRGRLDDLATEAHSQARAATKLADRVAFYRIAAVAAWQAQSGAVIDVTRDGRELCDTSPSGWNVAPRDCGLIAVAESIAVADAASLQVEALDEQFPGRANDIPNARESELVEQIELMLSRHKSLGNTLEKVRSSQAPEVFAVRLTGARDVIACNADTTWTLLSRVVDVDVARGNALKDRVDAALPAAGCQ